jgi:hypothetical protein
MKSEGSASAHLRATNPPLSIVKGIRLVAVAVSRVSRLFTTRSTLCGGIERDNARSGGLHNLEFSERSEHRVNLGARVYFRSATSS